MASIHRLRNVSFPPFLCCRAQTNRSRKRQFDGKSVKYHQLAEEENLHVTWTRIYHTLSLSFSTETKLRASYKKQRAIKSPRVSQNGNNDSPSHPPCHSPSPALPPPSDRPMLFPWRNKRNSRPILPEALSFQPSNKFPALSWSEKKPAKIETRFQTYPSSPSPHRYNRRARSFYYVNPISFLVLVGVVLFLVDLP